MNSFPRAKNIKILPFRIKGLIEVNIENEKEKTQTTSITIPLRLYEALKTDAGRCRRSIVGQLVAILDIIYAEADVELHGAENFQPKYTLKEESEGYQNRQQNRKVA